MENIIVILGLALILGGIILYLRKTKKKGGCAGCPYCNQCGSGCSHKSTKKSVE